MGLNIPPAVINELPLHTPPVGVPVNCMAVLLLQRVLSLPASTLAKAVTVIVTVADAVQPLMMVPVTVYVVVLAGDAITTFPMVVFNPVAGDHV